MLLKIYFYPVYYHTTEATNCWNIDANSKMFAVTCLNFGCRLVYFLKVKFETSALEGFIFLIPLLLCLFRHASKICQTKSTI